MDQRQLKIREIYPTTTVNPEIRSMSTVYCSTTPIQAQDQQKQLPTNENRGKISFLEGLETVK
jgi:hypothetical protein